MSYEASHYPACDSDSPASRENVCDGGASKGLQGTEDLPLKAYRVSSGLEMPVTVAPLRRAWMDATALRYANRCLPLLIANQSGWWVLNNREFTCRWNGGDEVDDLRIHYEGSSGEYRPKAALSHFGYGILTFSVPYLFRTPPGWNLLARGPANLPKDGVFALDGIIEADWAVATFTMNWKITRPNADLVFSTGDPIAMLVPQRRGDLERFHPQYADIGDMPESSHYRAWSQSRDDFVCDMAVPGTSAAQQGWQRHYMAGTHPNMADPYPQHQRRLHLRNFES